MANRCDFWAENRAADQYCGFFDTWGNTVWVGLAILGLILLLVIAMRRRGSQPPE